MFQIKCSKHEKIKGSGYITHVTILQSYPLWVLVVCLSSSEWSLPMLVTRCCTCADHWYIDTSQHKHCNIGQPLCQTLLSVVLNNGTLPRQLIWALLTHSYDNDNTLSAQHKTFIIQGVQKNLHFVGIDWILETFLGDTLYSRPRQY